MKVKLNAAQMSSAVWIGLGVAALGVAYVVYKSFGKFNEGTPYEGTGAVGTLGNIANQVLGGAPADIGSAIGTTLYDWTHDDSNANSVDLIFTFQDSGKKGTVDASTVDKNGYFRYWRDGVRYQLKKDAKGNRIAIKA